MLRFKEITEAQGLEVVSVTPYLNSLNLEETDRAFRAARLLGAKMIRVGAAGYDGSTPYPELYEATVRYLKEAERMAKQYGVKGVVETHHNTIAPSAGLAHRLVSHCDPEYIGVLFDPGNMVHEGYERFKMGLEPARSLFSACAREKCRLDAGRRTRGRDGRLAFRVGPAGKRDRRFPHTSL